MSKKFDAFVIFAEMRTGSNYLEATLNDLPDLHSMGELYNPVFMGKHNVFEMLGVDMDHRERAPLDLLDKIIDNRSEALPGFRFFHDHDPRVLERVLADPRIAKVILTRNPLDSYISLRIAGETGQWRLTDVANRKDSQIEFRLWEFEKRLAAMEAFQNTLHRQLQLSGQTAYTIRYEDINDVEVINGLAGFLGSAHQLDSTNSKLKKQNPSDLREKVSNYDHMVRMLAKLDPFRLNETPNFEPPRHAGVPNYAAMPDHGLLFMPIAGAADDGVRKWMASLAGVEPAALLRGMKQKDLRNWMGKHPGHRSFAVLRHPLERAYHVFNTYIVSNERPAFARARRVLKERYGLPIPAEGIVKGYYADQHKEAFIGFLKFLKGNLAGQTSLGVDPVWATQGAVLQGMSGFAPPDRIFREEELVMGLPALAKEVTGQSLPFDMDLPNELFPLDEIYDPEIEQLISEVYRKDFLYFGFKPWDR